MIFLAAAADAEKYFVLDVNYIFGSVTFNRVDLREVDRAIKYTDKSGFLIKAISFENKDLVTVHYNISENKNYLIYVPYYKNAARIEVYNLQNSKIMDVDASSFSDTCGNGICEEYESYESCTKDCKSGSKDDFCDGISDGICDPDCTPKTDADCKNIEKNETIAAPKVSQKQAAQHVEGSKGNFRYSVWILVILLAVVFVLLAFFIRKRKENKLINSLKQYTLENIRRGFTLQQIKDTLYREGYTQREIDKVIKSI